jgi:Survival protein SurE
MKMRILISNDDGIYSPGITALAKVASRFGEVRIVAPDVEQSSMSHAITASRPLRYKRIRLDAPIHAAIGRQSCPWQRSDGPPDLLVYGHTAGRRGARDRPPGCREQLGLSHSAPSQSYSGKRSGLRFGTSSGTTDQRHQKTQSREHIVTFPFSQIDSKQRATLRVKRLATAIDLKDEDYASKLHEKVKRGGLLLSHEGGSTLLLLPAFNIDCAVAQNGLDILESCA